MGVSSYPYPISRPMRRVVGRDVWSLSTGASGPLAAIARSGCSNPSLQLAGADLVAVGDGCHEHPSIPDCPGTRRQNDRLYDIVDDVVRDDDVDLHLRQQAHVVLLASIDCRVALLLAVAAHLGHR